MSDGSSSPLHEAAYRYLSDALMRGTYLPGQKLSLRALADQLGMSMSPIREAVGRLAVLKALEVFPKRGILVAPLSAELYLELVELRKLLEGQAAARACTRMSARDVDRLDAVNDRLLRFAGEGHMRKSMQENHRFHFSVYRSAGSEALLESIEHIWLRIGPSLNQLLAQEFGRDQRSLKRGFSNHRKLIHALRKRDVEGALGAITRDISVSTDYLIEGLRRQSQTFTGRVAQEAGSTSRSPPRRF
jgi:DNA-binding GntR family transcriptional regulator